jgi:hypothetical protein
MTVSGNGGELTTNQKAYVKDFIEFWYHPDAITNIISLKSMKQCCQVTYDSNDGEGGVFIVHRPNGNRLLFPMHDNGLHYHHTDSK